MIQKEKQEQVNPSFKISGDSSLGFEQELKILDFLSDYDDDQLVELLDQHPDALLLHKGIVDRKPELIFKLKQAKPEIYLQLTQSEKIDPYASSDYDIRYEIVEWIFKNKELAKKNPLLSQLLSIQALEHCNSSDLIDHSEYFAQLNDMVLSRKMYSFIFIKNKETLPPLALKKAILENPENIRFLPNASEELKELAVLLKPSCIKLIPQPSEHLKKIAISLDHSLIGSIESPSNEVKWFALIQNIRHVEAIDGLDETMEQYLLLSDPNYLSHLKNPTDYQKLLALKLNYRTFQSMENLSEELIEFMVKVDPYVLEFIDIHKESWCKSALNRGLGLIPLLKHDKRQLFGWALEKVEKEESSRRTTIHSTTIGSLFEALPSPRLGELENDLEQIQSLIQKYNFTPSDWNPKSCWKLPFKLPAYQFEKLFSKFPSILEIQEDTAFDNKHSMMRERSFAFGTSGKDDQENCLMIQEQFVSESLKERVDNQLTYKKLLNLPLNKKVNQLVKENDIQIPSQEQIALINEPTETWRLIEEKPLNLAVIEMKNRSLRLCRLAGRLDKESLFFSPFHWDECLENVEENDPSFTVDEVSSSVVNPTTHGGSSTSGSSVISPAHYVSSSTSGNSTTHSVPSFSSLGLSDDDLPF